MIEMTTPAVYIGHGTEWNRFDHVIQALKTDPVAAWKTMLQHKPAQYERIRWMEWSDLQATESNHFPNIAPDKLYVDATLVRHAIANAQAIK